MRSFPKQIQNFTTKISSKKKFNNFITDGRKETKNMQKHVVSISSKSCDTINKTLQTWEGSAPHTTSSHTKSCPISTAHQYRIVFRKIKYKKRKEIWIFFPLHLSVSDVTFACLSSCFIIFYVTELNCWITDEGCFIPFWGFCCRWQMSSLVPDLRL